MRKEVREAIAKYKADCDWFRNFLAATSSDKIIILSTHIVSDIEDIADHVMIMKDGELNRVVSREEYDDLERLYISIFMEGMVRKNMFPESICLI